MGELKYSVDVSYVIALYNCEKYIEKCLNSLVKQTIQNKEIIIINDGSSDLSLKICKKYQSKYKFIKIINQKNQGQSVARNKGINAASGKYIQFIDADDYIEIDSGSIFFKLCEENNLDMVRGKYHIYDEEKNQTNASNILKNFKYLNKVIKTRDYFIECIKDNIYEVTPILGFIKREFILKNNLFFKEGVTMEDHEFTMKCLTIDEKAIVMQIDYDFYTYVRHAGSTTTTPNIKKICDINNNYDSIKEYINSINCGKELEVSLNKAMSTMFYQSTSIYGRLNKSDKKTAKKIIRQKDLNLLIKYSINRHQKIKFIIFKYMTNIIDFIYYIKIKRNSKG